jgi:gluconokinase
MSPLPKLLWLKEEEPDVFRQAHRFVSVKDYVLYRLYGDYVTDHSLASATGLFRLDTLDWDEDVLSLLGIGRERRLVWFQPRTFCKE